MIDLHSHILPAIDDGAIDMEMALDMARLAVDDGVEVMACTPHLLPGVYEPKPQDVIARVAELNERLMDEGIDLVVVSGCEAHVRPDMAARVKSGDVLSIHGGKYVLVEAPPTTLPPHLDRMFLDIIAAGYTPILAHVERYRWAERAMPWVQNMVLSGVLMQVTAGSFFGDYGHSARELAMRLLDTGAVHLVASDAHDNVRRPPGLRKAWNLVHTELGESEARIIFRDRPEIILLGETVAAPQKARAEVL
ncbi:tyrosine-protein phosphatase [Aestuariivirga sp.]|uniref:tyrosine-protein phosphatase n=1 Tax=Aestuariivirga sp. TaxID=2650926 RepID=UPI003BAC5DC9